MKKLLIVAIICASTFAFAEGEKPNIDMRKAKTLEMISKRQANLETFKSCVTSAADKAAMKACREANKAANKAMRAARKSKRSARKKS
jgi:hypothetical protein